MSYYSIKQICKQLKFWAFNLINSYSGKMLQIEYFRGYITLDVSVPKSPSKKVRNGIVGCGNAVSNNLPWRLKAEFLVIV